MDEQERLEGLKSRVEALTGMRFVDFGFSSSVTIAKTKDEFLRFSLKYAGALIAMSGDPSPGDTVQVGNSVVVYEP